MNTPRFFLLEAYDDIKAIIGRSAIVSTSLVLASGIISASLFNNGTYAVATSLALCILLLIVKFRGTLQFIAFVYGVLTTLSALNSTPDHFVSGYGTEVTLFGNIVEEPYIKNGNWVCVIETDSLNGKRCKGKVITRWPIAENITPVYGLRLYLSGRLMRPMEARNPGSFDYRAFLSGQGISATMRVKDATYITVIDNKGGVIVMRKLIIPIREYIRQIVGKYIGEKGYLVLGILLGERRDMPEIVREDFRNAGLTHLLAVSGLNVGMLMLIAWQISATFGLLLPGRAIISLVFIWLYAAVTAFSPSVVRATIMGSIVLIGWLMQKKTYSGYSLMAAAFLILAVNPLTLFNPGFQLSFAATWAIIVIYPLLIQLIPASLTKKAPLKFLLESIFMSIAAIAGTVIIVACYFNQIAWISIVANLPAVPIVFLMLSFGLLLVFFGWLTPLGVAYGAILRLLTDTMNEIVSFFGSFPNGFIEVATPSFLLVITVAVLLLIIARVGKARWAVVALLVFLSFLFFISQVSMLIGNGAGIKITFLDVGQGDCSVISWRNGPVIMIDAGDRKGTADAVKWTLLPFFRHMGIKKIDAFFLSHTDNDHAGGLPNLLDNFTVGAVYHSADSCTGEAWHEAWKKCREKNIPLIKLNSGMQLLVSVDTIDILSPDLGVEYRNANDSSVVMMLKTSGKSVLYCGDIGISTERLLAEKKNISAVDIVKVPHHGSRYSSSDLFLRATKPKYAIISVGSFNKYHHPHIETIKRLNSLGSEVFRTDKHGAVEVHFSNKRPIVLPYIK